MSLVQDGFDQLNNEPGSMLNLHTILCAAKESMKTLSDFYTHFNSSTPPLLMRVTSK